MSELPAILVTGGTGTFGRAYIRSALRRSVWDVHKGIELAEPWGRVVSLSRDEMKAAALTDEFGHYGAFRAIIGDVRDRDRLAVAFRGIDTVVHAAALKRVDAGAYSPSEMFQTNITGTMNVVAEAIDAGVRRVVVISSDKAVNPTNIYGASKFCAETYAVSANNYGHRAGTRIAAVRYGNVLGSRGSVVHLWRQQIARDGRLQVTDPGMTRFIMTIEQAAQLVDFALSTMRGGEVFVPGLPSARMTDLAAAVLAEHFGGPVDPSPYLAYVGLRPGGEKLAEALLNEEEPRRTLCLHGGADYLAVLPSHHEWTTGAEWADLGRAVPEGFVYRSDVNARWLSVEELRALMAHTEALQ